MQTASFPDLLQLHCAFSFPHSLSTFMAIWGTTRRSNIFLRIVFYLELRQKLCNLIFFIFILYVSLECWIKTPFSWYFLRVPFPFPFFHSITCLFFTNLLILGMKRKSSKQACLVLHSTLPHFWPQISRDYPLNLSILISGGKETNKNSPSNGE